MDSHRRQHTQSKAGDTGSASPKAAEAGAAHDPEVLTLISAVESQLQGLKRVHSERERTKARLDQRQAELEAIAQEHRRLAEALAARERTAQAADAENAKRLAEIERRSSELAEIEKDSKARIATAAEERQAVESIAVDLATREKSLAERAARLDQLQAEVRALKHRLAETERTAAERAQELLRSHDEAAEMAHRLASLENQGPAAERMVATAKAELAKAVALAEAASGRVEARDRSIAELTARLKGLESRLAEQGAASAGHDQVIQELRQQAEQASAHANNLAGQRDAVSAQLADEQRRIAELETRLKAAEGDLSQARAANEQSGEALAAAQAVAQKLARQQQMTADAQSRLAAVTKELSQAAADRDEASASLANATSQARDLASQVVALREEADALRQAASSRTSRNNSELGVRRERMRRCRHLLKEREGKIRQAGEMLKARHQQYEQVLSMRGEVITAKRAVDTLQKRVRAASARTRAAAAVFYLAGLIAILGALSWAITRQVVPATYVARAVIVPESRTRTLSDADLANWQSYHEALLGDPQFLEFAAERMARRGITTMGTAGDLRAELEKSMNFQSAQDGQLVLELQGLGDERTARVLDTYVTALVSQANAARERRTDGASTTILEPAKAGSTPIEDPRPVYAAMILGGSTVLSLIIGGLIWGRLAAVKQKFETEARIDEFVESPDWPAAGASA